MNSKGLKKFTATTEWKMIVDGIMITSEISAVSYTEREEKKRKGVGGWKLR